MPNTREEQHERRQPAYVGLITLIAEMRPDWDIDQITAELIGCPWSEHLILAAVRATRPDDETKLRVADDVIKVKSQAIAVTQEQLDAYANSVRRRLQRNREARNA
ncbi:hypothetical protein ACQP2T_60805 [Nonomuraea sp. CA-143628]|uniref:hypothetical protein n=1 Tax=Nonomuraea sp. CA-143628 TaxID=3239997 RepID=UPI003D919F25